MKKIFLALLAFCIANALTAQHIFFTKNGQVSFFSKTPLENIDAVNNEVSSIMNTENGELVFAILLKSFHFERALMEEHFNENYVESDKFPKSTFGGKISNLAAVNFKKDGSYPVTVDGNLTLHGITKKITAPATVIIKGNRIQATSKFVITLKDYNIKIPSVVADKIAETMNISVDCNYELKQ